ncbi:nucleoside triphosphate pyrophosphohydrolase [Cohnella sp.]|uniref:nucleoside triphosphate pyrophosphohydrolase n=1 Tax=Cohnella sp. TaxID=1883426 RepID=UPI003565DE2C
MQALIKIVGLGSGDMNHLTIGTYKLLRNSGRIRLRTEYHPLVKWLREEGITFESFDRFYERTCTFDEVYEQIVEELLREAIKAAAAGERLIYAVPGHPMVAERTVRLLLEQGPKHGVRIEFGGGESFLDRAFLALGIDPIEGFQLMDGTSMSGFATIDTVTPSSMSLYRGSIQPTQHLLIAQVYDASVASEVKLTLMEVYPDDHPVTVAHELGVAGKESIQSVPLSELDRGQAYGNLSLIYVPPGTADRLRIRQFDRLHEIVSILRSPEGCPWDREQSHASIRKNLIEEMYEVLETIDDDDPDAMCEELGDLLLQIMLHAQFEEETGAFSVYDVIQGINEKLIRRHPHVFGERKAEGTEGALVHWNEIKRAEKAAKGIDPDKQSILSGIPRELPALLAAYELQKKAAKVGFDWDRLDDVTAKVEEEWGELSAAIRTGGRDEQLDELGDVLFSLVNTARFLKLDPDEALRATNRKFRSRFQYIEEQLRLKQKSFDQTDLIEMETLWQEAKKQNAT